MGERALSKIQWGLETTKGTAVAADTLLAGAEIKEVPKDRTPVFPEDNLGVRARSSRALIYQYLAQSTISVPHCYFQMLPIGFSMGVKGNVTPSEQNVGESDYLWTHTPSMTATNAPDSGTIEVGDDTEQYEIEYCMVERIKLAGVIAQGADEAPVSMELDYFGRQVTVADFTAAISAPTMEMMNAKLSRIYIDAAWADRGTTEKTSFIRKWELEILTGVHPKFMGSADKFFTTHGEGYIEAILTLLYEGNTTADTEFDAYQAGTKQAIVIKLEGSQIGAGDKYKLQFAVWGAYEGVVPLSEEDRGNNLHGAVFHGLYDTTGAQILELLALTNQSAI